MMGWTADEAAPPAPPPPPLTPQDVNDFRVSVEKLEQIAPPASAAVPTGVTNTEPVALVGAIQGVIVATLAVLTGFEMVDWSQEEIGLILALYWAVSNALIAFARAKVWSPASHAATVAEARAGGPVP